MVVVNTSRCLVASRSSLFLAITPSPVSSSFVRRELAGMTKRDTVLKGRTIRNTPKITQSSASRLTNHLQSRQLPKQGRTLRLAASNHHHTVQTRTIRWRSSTTRKRGKATLTPPAPHQTTLTELLQTIFLKPRTIPIPRWISPRHHTITLSEICGHSSFILVALSYAVDDFLNLRIIAVLGSSAMLFFTYFHPHGRILWLPLKWNLLFIAINSSRIGQYYWEQTRAVNSLSDDLLQLQKTSFYIMDLVDFARLMQAATVQEFQPGDLLVAQGQQNNTVRFVLEGTCRVLRDGKLTYLLERDNFISEAGLHAGLYLYGADGLGYVESCCSIVADRGGGGVTNKGEDGAGDGNATVRVLTWNRTELMDLMQRYEGLRRSLKTVLTWDIVRKLKGQRALLASGVFNSSSSSSSNPAHGNTKESIHRDSDDEPERWTQRRNEQTFHRYAAILHAVLQHPHYLIEHRKELEKYRMIHHIDDEHHNKALAEVGWTPEEFAAGERTYRGEDGDHVHHHLRHWVGRKNSVAAVETLKRDWRWHLREAYLKLVGYTE